jgi:hypothetical protein
MDKIKKEIEERKRKLQEAQQQGASKYRKRGDIEKEREMQLLEQQRKELEEKVFFFFAATQIFALELSEIGDSFFFFGTSFNAITGKENETK